MKIYFIGIGGIGVSALAKYYLQTGNEVSGSDLVPSEITDDLEKMGIKIIIGSHKKENMPSDADFVIYSPAVGPDNPELLQAKNYKLKTKSYPEALGELTKQYFTIAVSGTHGKSTTTAMLGLLLTKAGFDPTVILGTKLKEFGNSNFRLGKKQYKILVIEADEHFASFLNYWPKIIVLTNIEADHLDYYKSQKNVLKTFKEYVGHLPKDGWLVGNREDENINRMMNKELRIKNKIFYSLRQSEDIKMLKNILKVPGEHNVLNALAALAAARILKTPDSVSFKALSEYKGAWRRFEEHNLKLKNLKFKIISDYGHHPTEIKATLKAAREKYPTKKIWCVFQPHQYQRTYYLFNDFVKVLKNAPVDHLIITDIYDVAGREEKKIKQKVSAEKLVKIAKKPARGGSSLGGKNIIYVPKKDILNYLKKNLRGGEVLIIMGAGDIYELTRDLNRLTTTGFSKR